MVIEESQSAYIFTNNLALLLLCEVSTKQLSTAWVCMFVFVAVVFCAHYTTGRKKVRVNAT